MLNHFLGEFIQVASKGKKNEKGSVKYMVVVN